MLERFVYDNNARTANGGIPIALGDISKMEFSLKKIIFSLVDAMDWDLNYNTNDDYNFNASLGVNQNVRNYPVFDFGERFVFSPTNITEYPGLRRVALFRGSFVKNFKTNTTRVKIIDLNTLVPLIFPPNTFATREFWRKTDDIYRHIPFTLSQNNIVESHRDNWVIPFKTNNFRLNQNGANIIFTTTNNISISLSGTVDRRLGNLSTIGLYFRSLNGFPFNGRNVGGLRNEIVDKTDLRNINLRKYSFNNFYSQEFGIPTQSGGHTITNMNKRLEMGRYNISFRMTITNAANNVVFSEIPDFFILNGNRFFRVYNINRTGYYYLEITNTQVLIKGDAFVVGDVFHIQMNGEQGPE
jgi:hypothetical protein